MNFDRENLADDERNVFLSDRAQELIEFKKKHFQLRSAMENIKEVWIGSEGIKIDTKIELYLECICREMYLLASEAIQQDKIS